MSRKGQAATEFMILFIIVLIVLTATLFMSVQRSQDLTDTRVEMETMGILNNAANKINIAYLEGDGFMINLTLPNEIFSRNYTITIKSNYMSIAVSNVTYFKPILTDDITGNLIKGTNLIKNRNGVVVIS